jgi:hypothetical protein
MKTPLFSIHSIKALENRAFSVFRANIENTTEKLELARKLYPSDSWFIEFHYTPISVNVIFGA